MKNRILGQSWTTLKGHVVVISPCYWPAQDKTVTTAEGQKETTARQFSCGQTSVTIDHDELTVNGKDYGKLQEKDAVSVKGGTVYINSNEVKEVARNFSDEQRQN